MTPIAPPSQHGWDMPEMSRSGPKEARTLGAPLWEQGVLALWFYVTFISRPGDELLLYPLALFWTGAFILRRTTMIPLAGRSILVFVLPFIAALSMTWSTVPPDSLRYGVQWILGIMIAVYVSGRFAPHEIIRSVFLAGLVTVILVTPEMGDFGRRGPWGEKNIFAVRMVVIMLTAMAVAYNKYEHGWLRMAAFPLIPLCFIYIVIAQSATSLVFGMVSILGMTIVWLFWSRFSAIQHLRTAFLLIITITALTIVFVIMNMQENSLYESFLNSLGKDSTLTGRTMLWDAADRITRENPVFGVGAESFWLWGHGEANTLLEMSHKGAGTKFSFHNSYLEIQVHLGWAGLIALYTAVTWCMIRTVLVWFQTQSVVRSFFLLITAIVFISSFTESWLYLVFDTSVTMFYVAAISGVVRTQTMAQENAADHQAALFAQERGLDSSYGFVGAE